jgi:hypothetical protein
VPQQQSNVSGWRLLLVMPQDGFERMYGPVKQSPLHSIAAGHQQHKPLSTHRVTDQTPKHGHNGHCKHHWFQVQAGTPDVIGHQRYAVDGLA